MKIHRESSDNVRFHKKDTELPSPFEHHPGSDKNCLFVDGGSSEQYHLRHCAAEIQRSKKH